MDRAIVGNFVVQILSELLEKPGVNQRGRACIDSWLALVVGRVNISYALCVNGESIVEVETGEGYYLLHTCPPAKPTATTPTSLGLERNLCLIIDGKVTLLVFSWVIFALLFCFYLLLSFFFIQPVASRYKVVV